MMGGSQTPSFPSFHQVDKQNLKMLQHESKHRKHLYDLAQNYKIHAVKYWQV